MRTLFGCHGHGFVTQHSNIEIGWSHAKHRLPKNDGRRHVFNQESIPSVEMNHLYRPCMLIPWTKGITANIWHWSLTPDAHGVPILILSQTSAEEILCVFVGMNSIPVVWKDRNGFSIRGLAAPSPSAVVPIPWQLWHGKASFQYREASDVVVDDQYGCWYNQKIR